MTRSLCFTLFPGFQLLDVAGPAAAFEMANTFAADAYRLAWASAAGGLVPSSSGAVMVSVGFDAVGALDTLVVVGGDGVIASLDCQATLDFIRKRDGDSRRMTSVCSGAFLLAGAGLLDGRRVTTHWRRGPDFKRRFPLVKLDDDRIYIQDGKYWSSAGISAGIDLALALITQDLGEKIARQVAQQLVVYYQRPGGQSQFSAMLDMALGGEPFAKLLDYVRSHLASPLSVADLAEQACMSPRHFARVFAEKVGTTPARAVERLRVEAASSALESHKCSLQVVARQCGFADMETMRRAFIRIKGVPPSALSSSSAAVKSEETSD